MPILKTTSWYLVRPSMYRELGRRVWHKTFGVLHQTPGAAPASGWCAEQAVATSEALRRIAGVEPLGLLLTCSRTFFLQRSARLNNVRLGWAHPLISS